MGVTIGRREHDQQTGKNSACSSFVSNTGKIVEVRPNHDRVRVPCDLDVEPDQGPEPTELSSNAESTVIVKHQADEAYALSSDIF